MITLDFLVLGRAVVSVDGAPALVQPGMTVVRGNHFPAMLPLTALSRLHVPWADVGHVTRMSFDVVDEQNQSILPPDQPQPGGTITVDMAKLDFPFEENKLSHFQPLTPILPRPGWYFVVLSLDGREVARSQFRVARLSDAAVAALERNLAQTESDGPRAT